MALGTARRIVRGAEALAVPMRFSVESFLFAFCLGRLAGTGASRGSRKKAVPAAYTDSKTRTDTFAERGRICAHSCASTSAGTVAPQTWSPCGSAARAGRGAVSSNPMVRCASHVTLGSTRSSHQGRCPFSFRFIFLLIRWLLSTANIRVAGFTLCYMPRAVQRCEHRPNAESQISAHCRNVMSGNDGTRPVHETLPSASNKSARVWEWLVLFSRVCSCSFLMFLLAARA